MKRFAVGCSIGAVLAAPKLMAIAFVESVALEVADQ